MIVSHKHKFIFIKTRKTAGTSIEAYFEKYCDKNDIVTPTSYCVRTGEYSPRNYNGFFNHMKPKKIKCKIGDSVFDEYFKFTIIRNPWDKVVSRYYHKPRSHRPVGPRNFKKWLYSVQSKRCFRKDTQMQYCTIGNDFILDDYIRYESMQADLKRICFILNLEFVTKTLSANSEYRKKRRPYQDYYNEKTKNKVASKFKKDINYFGYEF